MRLFHAGATAGLLLATWTQGASALRSQAAADADARRQRRQLAQRLKREESPAEEVDQSRRPPPLPLDSDITISGRVLRVANWSDCGSPSMLDWMGEDVDDADGTVELRNSAVLERDVKPEEASHTPHDTGILSGHQWCTGSMKTADRKGQVALVLSGEAFRARDFRKRRKLDCGNPAWHVQKRLAENHLSKIVEPIESLGMSVDIYLGVTPCSFEEHKGRLEPWEPSYNHTQALLDFYGSRVKGVFSFPRETKMYERLADEHVALDRAMQQQGSSSYDYFIMMRFDVFLDQEFTDFLPKNRAPEHNGLTMYTAAHDFAWSYPGELWNCMKTFWDTCMRTTSNKGLDQIGWEEREQLGCFNFGKYEFPRWAQGYGFDFALSAIGHLKWPGHQASKIIMKTGCSGFSRGGDEMQCLGEWFWPPRSKWEEGRFMPYYFHIGDEFHTGE
mmetsp:Transcript_18841/g.42825  ORF Transcript_18841/g.42825 Transcript_18841/m.42825 type:complete len:446 (-) Transcript_18841:79-1416(-)